MSVNIYGMDIPVEDTKNKATLAAKLMYLVESGHISFISKNGVLAAETNNDVINQALTPKRFTAEKILSSTLSSCHPRVGVECDTFAREYTVIPSPRFVKVCGRVFFVKDDTNIDELEEDIEDLGTRIELVKAPNPHNIEDLCLEHAGVRYWVGYHPRRVGTITPRLLYCIEDVIFAMGSTDLKLDGTSYQEYTHATKAEEACNVVFEHMKRMSTLREKIGVHTAIETAMYLKNTATIVPELILKCITIEGELNMEEFSTLLTESCIAMAEPHVDEGIVEYTIENLKRARAGEEKKNAKRTCVDIKTEGVKEEKQ